MGWLLQKKNHLLSIPVLPSKKISQWLATFYSQSDCFIFFLFSTFCMRYSWMIVIFIVRLFSARHFVRIFSSSFLLKILGEASLQDTKMLTSALFWAYLFSLQISAICLSLGNIFSTDFSKELYLKNINFLRISCWLHMLSWKYYYITNVCSLHDTSNLWQRNLDLNKNWSVTFRFSVFHFNMFHHTIFISRHSDLLAAFWKFWENI